MSTYGTYDIDSVPAPSDYELSSSLWPEDIGHLTSAEVFNAFCTSYGFFDGKERALFHQFANQRHVGRWTWDALGDIWAEFYTWGRAALIAAQDASDLHDTQQDALI